MSANILKAAQDRYWFSCCAGHLPDVEREGINEAFAAGARWSMTETSRLNPYIAQFCEMIVLLGLFDDAQVVSKTGDGSAREAGSDGAAGSSG